ncbi:phage holin family protein [Qipengyuania aquimaris]|uniref:phage holin family protein n=1 Tax=Qipengyuania aquimaris TaxID=255984 RepID=UPI001CD3F252|nr:phage holin family protein [Qipengyuania aquimaris]MCA0902318.1 phage holin family protein [Qipengyuania aquimaris]
MLEEEERDNAPYEGPVDLPDEYEPEEEEAEALGPSLADDVLALLEDGKTYAEAEMAYQKSRAGFAANRIKGAIAFGLGAFGVLHLALIAMTVGLVIALAPLVGPWIATAIVTIALVALGIVFLSLLKARIDEIRDAFSEDGND